MITPQDFVDRWANSALREQQGSQSHFIELCELVHHKTPAQLDPAGEFFTFEEQVTKATGGKGRADVWYRGHFAWEYKGKHKDLDAAYSQLLAYRGDLGNPPLLVVCDFLEYRIYPQWVNTSGLPFVFKNEDLLDEKTRRYITWLLERPDKFQELRQTELEAREKLTLHLAEKFAHLAGLMRDHVDADGAHPWEPMQIARFLTKLVFSLFCEDVDIMPRPFNQPVFRYIITEGVRKLDDAQAQSDGFMQSMKELFEGMNGERQTFILKPTPYFNGGIFFESKPGAGDGLEVLDITQVPGAVELVHEVSEADWRFVNPTIFGTLFEGALDISKRAQLGAHYTGEADIRLVIDPVLMQPIYREWDVVRAEAEPLMQTYLHAETPRAKAAAEDRLKALNERMMTLLERTTVLDPACGSGNFLYMALKALKDVEGRVRKLFEPLGLPFRDVVTPRQLYGIEKDEFAANLAKVVVWIGYLQWRYEDEGVLHPVLLNRAPHPRALPVPIIKDKLSPDEPDRIVCDDAVMRYRTSPLNPLSARGEGTSRADESASDSPSPYTERGQGGEVSGDRGLGGEVPSSTELGGEVSGGREQGSEVADLDATVERMTTWYTPPELWENIKPLARQMRHVPTPAEDALWQAVRNRGIDGYRFRRQHTIEKFIVDFYCHAARMIVEVDGDIHDYTVEEDALRTEFLESMGFRVVRFRNDEVLRDMPSVLAKLRLTLKETSSLDPAGTSPAHAGTSPLNPVGTSPLNPLSARGEGTSRADEGASDSPSLYTERGSGGEVSSPYEPDWPAVDVIVGNPPFLGGSKMLGEMGAHYVSDLRKLYDGRVPGGADLVTYWFEKARAHIAAGNAKRAGLLATNSIRGGANREVLKRIKESGDIFMAWSDNPWTLEGAAVRISIVGFDGGENLDKRLDGKTTRNITADLTASTDVIISKSLQENSRIAFIGGMKKGSFDISDEVAMKMIDAPNPSGRNNREVLRRWINGLDITERPRNMWIIDFGTDMPENTASEYVLPMDYVRQHVKPARDLVRNSNERNKWWLHARPAPDYRNAIIGLSRYIGTARVAKHRLFVWLNPQTLPDGQVVTFARQDDYFFGVLHSYLHECWSLRMGTWLGKGNDPRYTPTTTFETFPFPWTPGKEDASSPHHAAISAAAKALHEEREVWLNPPDFDVYILDSKDKSKAIAERTLTNLYNALQAHRITSVLNAGTSPLNPLSVYREGTSRAVEEASDSPSPYTERGQGGEVSGRGEVKSPKLVKAARDFAPRLAELHDALDRAVLAAYGWEDLAEKLRTPEGDEELLRRLLAENLRRG